VIVWQTVLEGSLVQLGNSRVISFVRIVIKHNHEDQPCLPAIAITFSLKLLQSGYYLNNNIMLRMLIL